MSLFRLSVVNRQILAPKCDVTIETIVSIVTSNRVG